MVPAYAARLRLTLATVAAQADVAAGWGHLADAAFFDELRAHGRQLVAKP